VTIRLVRKDARIAARYVAGRSPASRSVPARANPSSITERFVIEIYQVRGQAQP